MLCTCARIQTKLSIISSIVETKALSTEKAAISITWFEGREEALIRSW